MAFRANRNRERKLIRVFQQVIDQHGLIDTGALRASVDVEVTISNNGLMLVDVSSQDYLKYLYERFFLLEDFSRKADFKSAIQDIWQDWIKDVVKRYPMQSAVKFLEKAKDGTRVRVQVVN